MTMLITIFETNNSIALVFACEFSQRVGNEFNEFDNVNQLKWYLYPIERKWILVLLKFWLLCKESTAIEIIYLGFC